MYKDKLKYKEYQVKYAREHKEKTLERVRRFRNNLGNKPCNNSVTKPVTNPIEQLKQKIRDIEKPIRMPPIENTFIDEVVVYEPCE